MSDAPGCPPTDPSGASEAERRKYHRYAAGKATCSYLVLADQEVVFPSRVADISAGGIRLIVDRPLQPGTVGTLDLYNIAREFPCKFQLRVVYALGDGKAPVMIGAAFVRELTAREICGLL